MLKSPTFFVGAERQRANLTTLVRREQQLAEAYHKNKPLCFSSRGYQKTHPVKAKKGHRDADARLEAPLILGVADGVSQIEEFGIDASILPNELLKHCEEIGMAQLLPSGSPVVTDGYRGPIPLVREAFEATESLGSTTLVLAILDNSTRIHGKLHPMIAVISVGDCELLILRRLHGRSSPLVPVFHTEMQRIDYNVQTPLQLARVDERIDEDFDESIALEVIEKGSAVHCVSAYEGDILILGSDGVFDNLFLDEIVEICNEILRPGKTVDFVPTTPAILSQVAQRIVKDSHAKSDAKGGQFLDTPIGKGGKVDDTSVVVAEIVEWTEAHKEIWSQVRQKRKWKSVLSCGSMQCGGAATSSCSNACQADDDEDRRAKAKSRGPEHESEYSESDDEEKPGCSIA
mmetsp:Transcript_98335/g.276540  ORF Transcript_98335/g.276540 Transcript_98335/m.276540 type:complete len:403 (-) Transcript_98335:132-1340(-)